MKLIIKQFVNFLEYMIFEARWILLPMYVMLCWDLVVFMLAFIKVIPFQEDMLAKLVSHVDYVMVGNLVVMIIQGSYTIFIRKMKLTVDLKPQWLDHVNAGTLKVKMGTSLIGISSVHLLQDFIDAEKTGWDTVWKHATIHTLFIISTIGLAYADAIIHPPQETHE